MITRQPNDLPPPDDQPSLIARYYILLERRLGRIGWVLARTYAFLDRATDGLLQLLLHAWTDFNQRDTRYAASLSYYTIFSIFPLLLLTVALVSGLVGPALAEEQVMQIAGRFFPAETLSLVEENLLLALQQRSSFGVVALIGLSWSALSLFSNLTVAIDNIFHPTHWRPMWHKRMLAFIMTIVLAVLLLTSFLTSTLFRILSLLLLDRPSTILSIATLFLPLGLNMAIFALLFRHVPRVFVRWDAIWPAAVLGGFGWELAQRLFVWYINNFGTFSFIYGSLGTVIVLLVWTYLSAAILLLCAEICNALNNWLEMREERAAS